LAAPKPSVESFAADGRANETLGLGLPFTEHSLFEPDLDPALLSLVHLANTRYTDLFGPLSQLSSLTAENRCRLFQCAESISAISSRFESDTNEAEANAVSERLNTASHPLDANSTLQCLIEQPLPAIELSMQQQNVIDHQQLLPRARLIYNSLVQCYPDIERTTKDQL